MLADGGVLPVTGLDSAADDSVTLTNSDNELRLELGHVVAWGTAAHLAARPAKQDLVVRADDSLLGQVQGIADGKLLVQTNLQKDPIPLDLEQIQSLRLAQPPRPTSGLHFAGSVAAGQPPVPSRREDPERLRAYAALQTWSRDDVLALPQPWDAPSSVSIALLAQARLAANGGDDLASLEPNYVRPSDAEIALAERSS